MLTPFARLAMSMNAVNGCSPTNPPWGLRLPLPRGEVLPVLRVRSLMALKLLSPPKPELSRSNLFSGPLALLHLLVVSQVAAKSSTPLMSWPPSVKGGTSAFLRASARYAGTFLRFLRGALRRCSSSGL